MQFTEDFGERKVKFKAHFKRFAFVISVYIRFSFSVLWILSLRVVMP